MQFLVVAGQDFDHLGGALEGPALEVALEQGFVEVGLHHFLHHDLQVVLVVSLPEHRDVFCEAANQEHGDFPLLPVVLPVLGAVAVLVHIDLLYRLRLLQVLRFARRHLLRRLRQQQVLHHEQDGLDGQVAEDFNEGGDQFEAGVPDGALLVEVFVLLVDEVLVVAEVVVFLSVLDDHVAADGGDEGDDAVLYYFLHVLPRDQSGQELNQLERHALHTVALVLLVALVTPDVFFLLLVVALEVAETLVVAEDFGEDGEVEVEELPGGLEDGVDAVAGVVDEVAEDDGEALEGVLLDVEEGFGVRLDDLLEQRHPRVEGLIQAVGDKLVIDAVRPRDRSKAQVESFKDLITAVGVGLSIGEG